MGMEGFQSGTMRCAVTFFLAFLVTRALFLDGDGAAERCVEAEEAAGEQEAVGGH
jgi:hypothetical protein